MKTATQLKALIKNISKINNVSSQILLRRYFMEVILEKIFKSKYKDNFVLKGGMLISSFIGINARTTLDMDLSIVGYNLSIVEIEKIMNDICAIESGEVKIKLTKIEEIREEFDYPGVRLTFEVAFEYIKETIKLDLTTGDPITPNKLDYEYRFLLTDKSIIIKAYPLETILAEKIESTLNKNVINTRMRDYYDIYVLYCGYRDCINHITLKEAIIKTCQKRCSEKVLLQPKQILLNILNDNNQKKYWNNYCLQNPYVGDTSFEAVIQNIIKIFEEINM